MLRRAVCACIFASDHPRETLSQSWLVEAGEFLTKCVVHAGDGPAACHHAVFEVRVPEAAGIHSVINADSEIDADGAVCAAEAKVSSAITPAAMSSAAPNVLACDKPQ